MLSEGKEGRDSLNRFDHIIPSPTEKHVPLPQYRAAVKTAVVIIAIIIDIFVIGAAALTAAFIRFQSVSAGNTATLLLAILPPFLLAAITLDCYRVNKLRSSFQSVGRALAALAIAAGLAFATAFAFQVGSAYSRLESGYLLVTAVAYLTVSRVLYKIWLDRISGVIDPHVVIFGPDFESIDNAGSIDRVIPSELPDSTNQKALERIYALVRHADRIILAFDDSAERTEWARFMRLVGIDAELIEPDLKNIIVLGVSHWEGTPTLIISRGALNYGERAIKRIFDLTISAFLLCLASPLLLLLIVLIKYDSPGPVIFAQPRVGRNNHRYQCYKLRTMHDDAADSLGSRSTRRNDDRITKIGKFLRRASLDELPQLWNVVRGDMSLVGPRPHALGSTAEGALFWEAVPDYWTRHAMRPGITGLAQVRGLRGATITREDIEKRVAADIEYINSWSILLDFKILLQTIRVIWHRNAF